MVHQWLYDRNRSSSSAVGWTDRPEFISASRCRTRVANLLESFVGTLAASQQPISEPDKDGKFEVIYRVRDFTLDPCVRDREKELAVRPDDLVLNNVWAFTHSGGPSGLEVTEVELISPEQKK